MQMRTPAEKAYADLAEFETTTFQDTEYGFNQRADGIRKQFAAGGVTVDEQLDGRIKAAGVRANRVSAEGKLAEFETTTFQDTEYGFNQRADGIRKQFAAGGVTVDEQLDGRIKAAGVRANRVSAEGKLAEFETTTFQDTEYGFNQRADGIRKQFAAGGVTVDEQLDGRIKAAGVRANRVSAEGKLAEFETTTFQDTEYGFNQRADGIRKQFAAGGVTVDEQLDGRIKAAGVRANRVSAEGKLAEFETTTFQDTEYGFNQRADGIRKQFAAGGIEVATEGKLPDGLEARLNAATARATRILVLKK